MEHVPLSVLAQLFELLTARDVLQLSRTCRALAPHSPVVRDALELVITHRFGDVTPYLRADDQLWPRSLLTLHCAEMVRMKDILALTTVLPFEDAGSCRGTSLIVSKAWLVAWKRSCLAHEQFLAQFRPSKKKQQQQQRCIVKKHSKKHKVVESSSVERAIADANVAVQAAGRMIVCPHDRLLPLNQCIGRCKRVILTRGAYRKLAVYAPELQVFPLLESSDCSDCVEEYEAREQKLEEMKRSRFESEIAGSDALVDLLLRKTGYPNNLFAPNHGTRNSSSPRAISIGRRGGGIVAASYFLVPKKWLIKWRKFVRSEGDDLPGPILNSELVCLAHQRSVVPPYISMFLTGSTLEQSLRATQGYVSRISHRGEKCVD